MKSPFTDERLDEFRLQGDTLADEVLDAFAKQYDSSVQLLVDKLEHMMRMPSEGEMNKIIQDHFSDETEIQVALKKYFNQAVVLPDWIDAEKMTLGGYVFQDHVFSSIMILGCASLPSTYMCNPEAKVLGFTRRLIDDAPRRLIETAQMVTDVMGEGGLVIQDKKLSGKGVQSILKIRLIHASIRHLMLHKEKLAVQQYSNTKNSLLTYVFDSLQDGCTWHGDKKPDKWNKKDDGIPINQEALAVILLTFSYVILRGLKKIGVKLNKQQQDAYLHSWNVVGYLLGIDDSFLNEFAHYKDAEVVYTQIMSRRRGRTHDGVLLQQSLLDAFTENAVRLIPFGRLLHVRRLARLITSKLISEASYSALNLKLSFYDRIVRFFIWLGVRFFGLLINYRFLRVPANYVFGRIAQSIWDWRKDFPDKPQIYKKTGVCKPLIIDHKLVSTSYLSGKRHENINN